MLNNTVNVDEIYKRYDDEDDRRRVRVCVAKSQRIRRDPRGRVIER